MTMQSDAVDFDVAIVGAGIAGSALAHALSVRPFRRPLRVALLERSLDEPDRIVGELLQPGGVSALEEIGLSWCLENIDAVRVKGYCVIQEGESVHIPYPDGHEGRSFHHGKFVQALRKRAKLANGVKVIEATVSDFVECPDTGRVTGVRASRRDAAKTPIVVRAKLVVVADGCLSNLRNKVLGENGYKASTKSHFIGSILKDVRLPIPEHGTVCFVPGSGPVLLYQIGADDTRILMDVKEPVPKDLKAFIHSTVMPALPTNLRDALDTALEKDRLRRMPNSFLPPSRQGSSTWKPGVIMIGDSWNMRHPLTGGGMTVALNDVVLLSQMLTEVEDLANWTSIVDVIKSWYWDRKPLSSTINILSVALYDLFGADDEELAVLRTGCFKYFELGGECIHGPVSLLSGIARSPSLLFYHFFSVALYSIWVMFTHPHRVQDSDALKPIYRTPSFEQYPILFLKSIRVFWTAIIVFFPLLWTEIR